jgi:hypothetical protein
MADIDASQVKIYRLKITLKDSQPSIWRQVEVPSHFTLGDLDLIIQGALAWDESHPHQFIDRRQKLFYLDRQDGLGDGCKDEESITVGEILPNRRSKLQYEYDFGDSWMHEIAVEAIEEPLVGISYPRLVGGECAAPPEDSGGIYAYNHAVAIMADRKHPEYQELREFYPPRFNAKVFSLAKAQKRFRAFLKVVPG